MKEELIAIINSYAAAHHSGDPLLQKFAVEQLQTFLNRVELVGCDSEVVENSN